MSCKVETEEALLDAGGFPEIITLYERPGMASNKSNKRPDIMWGAAGRSYLKMNPFPPVLVSRSSRSWRKARREAESQAAWEVRKR